jgi:hypothetical protein
VICSETIEQTPRDDSVVSEIARAAAPRYSVGNCAESLERLTIVGDGQTTRLHNSNDARTFERVLAEPPAQSASPPFHGREMAARNVRLDWKSWRFDRLVGPGGHTQAVFEINCFRGSAKIRHSNLNLGHLPPN